MLKVYVGFHDLKLLKVDVTDPRAFALTVQNYDDPPEVVTFASADDLRYWSAGPESFRYIMQIYFIEQLRAESPHIEVSPMEWQEILNIIRSEELGDWCIFIGALDGPSCAILGKSVPELKGTSLGKELMDDDYCYGEG